MWQAKRNQTQHGLAVPLLRGVSRQGGGQRRGEKEKSRAGG